MKAIWILPLVLLGTACGSHNEDEVALQEMNDKDANMVQTDAQGTNQAVANDEPATTRRYAMSPTADCIRRADDTIWKDLNLTTDQRRLVLEVQTRLRDGDKRDVTAPPATNTADAQGGDAAGGSGSPYPHFADDGRAIATILTEEQLEKWQELCSGMSTRP